MSKLVAFAAIQGGYNIVSKVEGEYQKALDTYDASSKVGFPNTAYYLPVIYSLLGIKVETLEDMCFWLVKITNRLIDLFSYRDIKHANVIHKATLYIHHFST